MIDNDENKEYDFFLEQLDNDFWTGFEDFMATKKENVDARRS